LEVIDTNYINNREIIVKKHEASDTNYPTLYYYVEIYANDYDKDIINNIGLNNYLENIQEEILNDEELLDYADIFFKGKEYSTKFGYDESFYETDGRMMYLMSFEDM
jgi:hypothetical protein